MRNIDWDFISDREGVETTGYVPRNKDNTIDENSGVTIGAGFDLGQQTEETIKNIGFKDLSILDAVKPYLGLKGAKADEVAKNLTIPEDKLPDFNNTVNNYYADNIEKQYNKYTKYKKFNELDPALQTVITSVGFQYGDLKRTPNFFKEVLNDNIEGVVAELRDFGDDYSSRRNLEADYLINKISNIDTKKKLEVADDPLTQKEMNGELYMDRVFKTFQNQPEPRPSLFTGAVKAAELNFLAFTLGRTLINKSFAPDPNGFSWKDNEAEIKKAFNDNQIRSEYYEYFTDAVSREHFYYLIDRVKLEQENRDILHKMGGTGLFLDIGAYVLDPLNLIGFGYIQKAMMAKQSLTASRLERFFENGLVFGAYEGATMGIQANESPSVGAVDVIIAAALGGALGGGISVIGKAQLSRVAKDIENLELKDAGLKKTPKGEKLFEDVNTSKIDAKTHLDVNELLDTSDVVDKSIIYSSARNWPTANLFSLTKSGAFGSSLSELARSFSYKFLEDPIGYAFKGEGKVSKRIASQEETVELIRDKYLAISMNGVAREVRDSLNEYLKENGLNFFSRLANVNARTDFMQKVTRAIRSFDPNNKNLLDKELLKNKHIARAANAYADAFERWGKTLKDLGIEGAEFNVNRGYIPRRLSLERYAQLEAKIGESGIIELITKGILDKQKYLNIPKDAELKASLGVKELKYTKPNFNEINNTNQAGKIAQINKLKADLERTKLVIASKQKEVSQAAKEEAKKIKEQIKKLEQEVKDSKIKLEADFVGPDKAELMAKAIVSYIKNSKRTGGFDLEALLRVKDPEKLKEFFKESFPHLKQNELDELTKNLANVMSTITSGRLVERIKLNESFETTIKGQKVRLDELYENNVDLLYNDYSHEMAGWSAMAERVGIKSRDEWNSYKNALITDIEKSYSKDLVNKQGVKRWFTERRLQEEISTLDSVFQNLMGRSGEAQTAWAEAGRTLRRYNFIRVLNQVGIASIPELGNIISATGIKAFVQNIPEFKNALRSMRSGALDDEFFKELKYIGYDGFGEDYLRRITHATEQLDQGTAINAIQSSGKLNNFLTTGEKITSWTSGLTVVDTTLRRIATRAFIDKFADDLIKLKASNFNFNGVNLNRYKVLGFSEAELKKFANEFSNGAVTTEATFWGRKVKSFNFANWKDHELLTTFAHRLNRHVKRTVQYNFIGDSSQFFSDNTLGKMLGQFRQFSIVAWNKQFLHNVAMNDFRTYSNFTTTMFVAALAYMGQTHFNSIGMGVRQKAEYLEKRIGLKGDYSKIGLAAFQRTGWSSVMPAFADIATSALAPNYRFNTRTSGLEVNLWSGNPTISLLGDVRDVGLSFLKSVRSDYSFSKVDLRRLTHLFAWNNSYGISNLLHHLIDNSPLPDTGKENLF